MIVLKMRDLKNLCIFCVIAIAMVSCSGKSYVDCIPSNTVAIMKYDTEEMAKTVGDKQLSFLSGILGVNDISDAGIDASNSFYLFETNDGTIGMCASVASLQKFRGKLKEGRGGKVKLSELKEKDDILFVSTQDNWLIGATDEAMIIVNPTIEQSQSLTVRRMTKWLKAKGKKSFSDTEMFERLEASSSPVAMVAQANVFPEMITSLVSLGMPKNVDATKLFVSVEMMSTEDGVVHFDVSTYSDNASLNDQIAVAKKGFNTVNLSLLPDVELLDFSVMLNVVGDKLLSMLHDRKEFQSALAGINMAIDIDKIIKTFEGEVIMTTDRASDRANITLSAETSSCNWLEDVGYWKQSCPAGSSIKETGKQWYDYEYNGDDAGKSHFLFGMRDANHFYGSTKGVFKKAIASNDNVKRKLPTMSKDSRMVVLIRTNSIVNSLDKPLQTMVTDIYHSFFGNNNLVVVTVK